MNKITKSTVLLLFFLFVHSAFAETKSKVSEILKKVENTYSNCKSYMDTGYVETVYMDKDGKNQNIRKLTFTTSYIRPNKFRFEYGEQIGNEVKGQYIIWKNGGAVKTFCKGYGVSKPKSLSLALAFATGLSADSAHIVPSLLRPGVGGKLITHIKNPTLLADKKDKNEILCYLIKGNAGDILWIQKETFLISKITGSIEYKNFTRKRITVYNPQINIKISQNKFRVSSTQ